MKPGKHSDTDTRIKPLHLTNDHGCYITAVRYTQTETFVRWGLAVTYNRIRYQFVTVLLLKRLRDGRFTSETTVRRFQKRNGHLDPEVV
jgi:hypothetical protein